MSPLRGWPIFLVPRPLGLRCAPPQALLCRPSGAAQSSRARSPWGSAALHPRLYYGAPPGPGKFSGFRSPWGSAALHPRLYYVAPPGLDYSAHGPLGFRCAPPQALLCRPSGASQSPVVAKKDAQHQGTCKRAGATSGCRLERSRSQMPPSVCTQRRRPGSVVCVTRGVKMSFATAVNCMDGLSFRARSRRCAERV